MKNTTAHFKLYVIGGFISFYMALPLCAQLPSYGRNKPIPISEWPLEALRLENVNLQSTQSFMPDFETGTFDGFTLAGTAFGNVPSSAVHGGLSGWEGTYWGDSFNGGETATGTLTSIPFIPGNIFRFKAAGWDGVNATNNQNYYYLRQASDNAILFTAKPPQDDKFAWIEWNTTTYNSTSCYFQIVDGNSDAGYAWLSVDGSSRNQQTISFNEIAVKQNTDAPFTLSAASSSGLPIAFSVVSGPAIVNGNTLTLSGTPGLVAVKAYQPGDVTYNPAEGIQYFFVENAGASKETVQLKAYGDSWVATDAIDRTLPQYSSCGDYRQEKYVGMFYFIWHANGRIYDSTTYSDLLKANANSPGFEFRDYYWGEPENGFYHPGDPWSTRRNLQMLANAGVDFVFIDFTNGDTGDLSLESFMNVALEMYNKGIPVPKISFFLNENYQTSMPSILNRIYSHPEYDPMIFKWHGKPLLLADSLKCANQYPPAAFKGIKDYFTWRKTWAFDPNQWNFLDLYPQDYASFNGQPEQISVTKAQGAPVNSPFGKGSSFQKGKEPKYDQFWETDQFKYGFAFDEQWSRAFQIDPSIVCITGWNEFMAGAWISSASNPVQFMGKTWDDPSWRCVNQANCPSKDANGNHIPHGWYVVDEFNTEFNRDIEPMKGGCTDNYYYQTVSNIRKFKGMSPPEPISVGKTIQIDGSFVEWSAVTPVFKDAEGDVQIRNIKNVNGSTILTNNTARNDIVESRSTYDAHNIYFYVKTAMSTSQSTDPNWMLLFIDADRNKGTGWEGYEYVVNHGVKSSTETTLKQWDGTSWGNEVVIPLSLNGSEMELSIPRSAVMLDKATPEFYFHWSDNAQQLKDITCFFTDGESAPDRRFNYDFSTLEIQTVPQTSYKNLVIPGTVEFEDFDNGGAGVAYGDATMGNSGGTYRFGESVDIEPKTEGGVDVGWINSNEWLEYTVDVKAIGTFTATIIFAASTAYNQAILSVDNVDKTGILTFPSTGGLQSWSFLNVDLQLAAGKHILKFFIQNAAGSLSLDNMAFKEKNVVYPGDGIGLNKSLWKGGAPATWFKDSICSQTSPVIDEIWAAADSPGCGIDINFWNARYTGEIQALFSETYTFYFTIKDLGRLWVNNQLLIDKWIGSMLGNTATTTIDLIVGQKVPIRVDFAKKTGDGKVRLEWSSASNPKEVVPQYQLYSSLITGLVPIIRASAFSIYPNPATNQITVNSGSEQADGISLFDVFGRMAYTNDQPFTGQKTINLSLGKGIYMVKLKGNGSFAIQKLIIE